MFIDTLHRLPFLFYYSFIGFKKDDEKKICKYDFVMLVGFFQSTCVTSGYWQEWRVIVGARDMECKRHRQGTVSDRFSMEETHWWIKHTPEWKGSRDSIDMGLYN